MNHFSLSLIAGSLMAGLLIAGGPAQAQNPVAAAVDAAAGAFIFGGHHYCWYPGGWKGPGWYWCGYANRHGLGWGGGEGFHGWHHGGRGPARGGPRGGHDDHHDHH